MEDCKKKRILVLFPSIYLYGKERSNLEVFKIMDKKCDLLIIQNKAAVSTLKSSLSKYKTIEIDFPVRNSKHFKLLKYLYGLIKSNLFFLLVKTKFNPDVIYLNNEMSVYDFYFNLQYTSAKICYRLGDIPAFPSLKYYALNSYMWRKIVVRKVETVICISNFIKKELVKTGRNNAKDKVIYNYPPDRNSISVFSKKTRTKELVIGYLGQIRELKGVHILMDAAISSINKDMDLRLLIAGDTSLFSEYTSFLLSKISNKEIGQRISFLGELTDINTFFKEIDILCVPTIWPEALGNVLEAKQYYTPLVIFPSGGMPELVHHMLDGYLCKNRDVESLVESFDYYYEHPEQVAIHGEASYLSLEKLGITYENFQCQWNEVLVNLFNDNI